MQQMALSPGLYSKGTQNSLRIFTGILLAIIAINALGGGIYGMTGAKEVPLEWLRGSPFETYFLPSFILLVVVGGSCAVSAVLVFMDSTFAKMASRISALVLATWIVAQLSIIGFVSWLQPAIVISAAIILVSSSLMSPSRRELRHS